MNPEASYSADWVEGWSIDATNGMPVFHARRRGVVGSFEQAPTRGTRQQALHAKAVARRRKAKRGGPR